MNQPLPSDPLEELKTLQRQIQTAISMRDQLIPMPEQERLEYTNRYGRHAFVVGDYVITKWNR